MNHFMTILIIFLISISAFANIPNCFDRDGNVLEDSIERLQYAMDRDSKTQLLLAGKIVKILPEDKQGRPHQKFVLNYQGLVNITVIHNTQFESLPLNVGDDVLVCGEYLNSFGNKIHWTHFDPREKHLGGFIYLNGMVYGDEFAR